jgi:heptosyltransferase-2
MLVQQHHAVGLALEQYEGVVSVGGLFDLKSMLLEKEDVRGQAFNLIIHPEDALGAWHGWKLAGKAGQRRGKQEALPRCPAVPYIHAPMSDALRILAIRFSSIGDILLTTPLLRAIRARHPAARLAMLTKGPFTPLLSDNPRLNEVIALQPGQPLDQLALDIRKQEFSHILDLHGSLRSRALRFLVPAARWSGYRNHRVAREILIRYKRNVYPRDIPVPERYFDAARALDVQPDGEPPEFFLSELAKDEAARWLLEAGLPVERRLIGLAPGAAHNTKRWPLEYWQDLARRLTAAGFAVVTVGGSEDRAPGQAVSDAAGTPNANAAGRFGLQGTGALLARCRALVSGDTGVMHMATGVGTPVVALFGPTVRPFGFFPYSRKAIVLERDLDCRPCTAHGSELCPLGHHHCLRQIAPAEVEEVVLRMVA